MLQKATFLGISLNTSARRRGLVIAYYAMLGTLLSIVCWKQTMLGLGIICQTATLGGFFGGIRSEGVIKPYSEQVPEPGHSGIQELNLSGTRSFAMPKLLDEREIERRNQAHYTAYRLLRWVICASGALYVLGMNVSPSWLTSNSLSLLWGLTVFVLSLPQSVILWTEPDPLAEGSLELVPHS